MMVELYVIGDVHGLWDDVDTAFLEGRGTTAIFVGDYGDEDVRLVAQLAAVRAPKAITFGNHDAWHAMRGRGPREAVERQLALAGDAFVGYRAQLVDGGKLALVGARPFSWGGGWFDASFYEPLFGVRTMNDSAARIADAASAVPPGVPLLIVGHNGPRGLGATADAIWGRDFQSPPADWGDPDQESAIERLRAAGRTILGGVAGHMHERLAHGSGTRQRIARQNGSTFVNAAVVPRHQRGEGTTLRHFVRMEVDGDGIHAEDVWVDDDGEIAERRTLS
jgi:uncharacterized protein (TIGR04168 family)